MSSDPSETMVANLVAECLLRIDEGAGPTAVDEVCREHPELRERVRSGLALAGSLPDLSAEPRTLDALVGVCLAERYQVVERIGAGAMGLVYRAQDIELARDVAVKVLHSEGFEQANALLRFEREAQALAAVRHDAVVAIFDRGATSSGDPFLVMELVEGTSYAEILQHAELYRDTDGTDWLADFLDVVPERSYMRLTLAWLAAIAHGVAAAHRAGVYHRDLKPSNIRIRRSGEPVILDFGIAALDGGQTLTRTSAAVGTPTYMAPEALSRGRSELARLDVYGLAATLYHGVTRRAPYSGSPTEVLAALATREPVLASRVRPGISADVQAILDHGLARRPAARYATPGALAADLEAVLAHRPVSVRPTSNLTRVSRRLARSKMFLGAALALAAVLIAVGVVSWREAARAEAGTDATRIYRTLPANLTVVEPANRRIESAELRSDIARRLDALVATGHEPVVARALRGNFRFDQGDLAGARQDFAAISTQVDTPYTQALSRCYGELTSADVAELKDALASLPAPRSAWDAYLHGLHLIRAGQHGDSGPWLDRADLEEVRHAAELRFLLSLGPLARLERENDLDGLMQAAEVVVRSVRRREGADGYRSPTTAQVIASARLRQGFAGETILVASAGLELAPRSHVLLQNRGRAYFLSGDFERAKADFDEALELAPGHLPIQSQLARVLVESGDVEGARALVAHGNYPDGRKGPLFKAQLVATIELGAALRTWDEPESSIQAASAALAACAELSTSSKTRLWIEPIATAIEQRDEEALGEALAEAALSDPLDTRQMRTALRHYHPAGDVDEIERLDRWIRSVHRALARRESVAVDVLAPASAER